ncbi:MAG: membrane protein insertase YidC [Propionibacteriales bacterium]|nr:membrane protein insertase YidC [Propionibacteriales bacterium]
MIDFFKDLGSFIIGPLEYATSFILRAFHTLFTGLFGESNAGQGWAWALAIVCLTIVVRILLIPLFVKQIKSSRNMQLLQPKVKELQKKYGHDRERLAQETMALYRETGTNPFASCLPLILQMPVFFALFRLIREASTNNNPLGVLTESHVEQLQRATLFGADVHSTFLEAGGNLSTQVLAIVLVVFMTSTMFLTQKQLMSKNMPKDAMSGPFAQQQKMLLYVLPVVFAASGVYFPIGLLVYWTTSNLWTMGQQFYVIRRNPAPGTQAFDARQERLARKGKLEPGTAEDTDTAVEEAPRPRTQPKRQPRSQRTQKSVPAKQPMSGGEAESAGSSAKASADGKAVEDEAVEDEPVATGSSSGTSSASGSSKRPPAKSGGSDGKHPSRKSGKSKSRRKSGRR